MSGPVDVLAVLDENIRRAEEAGNIERSDRLQAARAAIAELIEADKEYDTAVVALSDLNRRVAEHGWIEVEHDALRKACWQVVRAQSRRQSALTNAGDAS